MSWEPKQVLTEMRYEGLSRWYFQPPPPHPTHACTHTHPHRFPLFWEGGWHWDCSWNTQDKRPFLCPIFSTRGVCSNQPNIQCRDFLHFSQPDSIIFPRCLVNRSNEAAVEAFVWLICNTFCQFSKNKIARAEESPPIRADVWCLVKLADVHLCMPQDAKWGKSGSVWSISSFHNLLNSN